MNQDISNFSLFRQGRNITERLPEISPVSRVYFPDIAKAVEWLRLNKTLFRAAVAEPLVLYMTEEEIVQAREEKDENCFSAADYPRATSFIFRDPADFDLFTDVVMFEMGLKVDCEMHR